MFSHIFGNTQISYPSKKRSWITTGHKLVKQMVWPVRGMDMLFWTFCLSPVIFKSISFPLVGSPLNMFRCLSKSMNKHELLIVETTPCSHFSLEFYLLDWQLTGEIAWLLWTQGSHSCSVSRAWLWARWPGISSPMRRRIWSWDWRCSERFSVRPIMWKAASLNNQLLFGEMNRTSLDSMLQDAWGVISSEREGGYVRGAPENKNAVKLI